MGLTHFLRRHMYHHSISESSQSSTLSKHDENDLVKMFKLVASLTDTPIDMRDLRRRFMAVGLRVAESDLAYMMKVRRNLPLSPPPPFT